MKLEFPLSLTHRDFDEAAGPTAGWLSPGATAEVWVRTLCAAKVAQLDRLPLYPVPKTRSARDIAGLFVPLSQPVPTRLQPRPLAFTLLGGRLFVPANAQLRVPLNDAEFSSLFLHDVTVFLPGLGVIGFESEDAVQLADLLALPDPGGQLWNLAHPGLLPLPETLTIVAANPMEDFVQMMEQSRGDIGGQQLADLPGFPGESKETAGKGLRESFYDAVRKFTGKVPTSDEVKGPTWVNRLEDWANSKLGQIQEKQSREIDRLLHWLETDPDKGLRFALPIGGEGSRGFTAAGSQLSERNVDFNLNQLGGGDVVSPWSLDWNQTQRLMNGYRQAANRELSLQRYRRAAYIFAVLLNDYGAAANALKSGHFYREAAQLYAKFLNDEYGAAECLKNGGLFEDALQLYEQMAQFETMGDLYRELGREEDALQAYERAVTEFNATDRPTHAAKLIAEKLEQTDRALDLLFAAWPRSQSATAALESYFDLCAQADENERAMKSIGHLRDAVLGRETPALAQVFADLARDSGHMPLRDEASDAVRVIVGRYLSLDDGDEGASLTKIVSSLNETDLLLKRDSRRFRDRFAKPRKLANPPVEVQSTNSVTVIEKLRRHFMSDFICRDAVAFRDGLAAIGRIGSDEKLMRYSVTGSETYVPAAAKRASLEMANVKLVPEPAAATIHVMSRELTAVGPMSADEQGRPIRIELVPAALIGLAFDDLGGRWELRLTDSEMVLNRLDSKGTLTSTHHLTQLPAGISPESVAATGLLVPMAAFSTGVYFALDRNACRFDGKKADWHLLPGPIRRIVASHPNSRPRMILVMEEGAGFTSADESWKQITYFADAERGLQVAFTRSGFLAAVDPSRLRVFSLRDRNVTLARSLPNLFGDPVAVLPGVVNGQFRVLTEREILTFELG